MIRSWRPPFLFLAALLALGVGTGANAGPLPGRDQPLDRCAIWFIGSSTIERWSTLAADFAPWRVRNSGIGGAVIPDLNAGIAQEPPVGRPAAIVFYGGENDIAAGGSAERALQDFRTFLALKDRRFGGVPVIAVSVKPGPSRWANRPRQQAYDAGVARLAAQRPDLDYVDIRAAMLDGGRPGPYYVEDGVHMNPAGYAIWTRALRPALDRILPGRRAACSRRR